MYPPRRPTKPTIDPCELVRTPEGVKELRRLIGSTGYAVQDDLFDHFVLALKLAWPWMLSGHRGCGKTGFFLAVIEACNLPHAWLQCHRGKKVGDVLGRWDRGRQEQFVIEAVRSGGRTFEQADGEQWSRRFLKLGPVLDAYDYAVRAERRPVLVIDEEDKLEEDVEDSLLEVLGQGCSHIEEYAENGGYVGFAPGSDLSRRPIVLITTNEIRNDASSPFRSRCIYTLMRLPNEREQVIILRSRFPQASAYIIKAVARVFWEIRGMSGFKDKPGIREALALTQALLAYGVEDLDKESVRRFAGVIAKRPKDFGAVIKGDARLAAAANRRTPSIDEWVDKSFEVDLSEIPFSLVDEQAGLLSTGAGGGAG